MEASCNNCMKRRPLFCRTCVQAELKRRDERIARLLQRVAELEAARAPATTAPPAIAVEASQRPRGSARRPILGIPASRPAPPTQEVRTSQPVPPKTSSGGRARGQ